MFYTTNSSLLLVTKVSFYANNNFEQLPIVPSAFDCNYAESFPNEYRPFKSNAYELRFHTAIFCITSIIIGTLWGVTRADLIASIFAFEDQMSVSSLSNRVVKRSQSHQQFILRTLGCYPVKLLVSQPELSIQISKTIFVIGPVLVEVYRSIEAFFKYLRNVETKITI